MQEIPLYWNEDHTEYAVLVSRGFGAGFSTWECSTLAYDARVIEFYLQHRNDEEWMRTVERFDSDSESPAHKEAKEFFKSLEYIDVCPYLGGFCDCEITWIKKGERWIMREYDGSEYIEYANDEYWNCF